MAEPRPFPPSPRRHALARAAGLTWASPLLVGGAALAAVVAAFVVLGRAAAAELGVSIASACHAADGAPLAAHLADVVPRVVALASPLLGAAAIAAIAVHLAQTRAPWLPRRRPVPGAPTLPAHRAARTGLELLAAATIGATTFGWLWVTAQSLSALVQAPTSVGDALAAFVATLAIAVVALGIVDALVRKLQLDAALRMTRDEKREDDRMSAADPRWRARQLSVLREPAPATRVAQSALLLLGDDLAIAIGWDATRQPVPTRTVIGRRARATQLVALARRHGVPMHRDATLARALAGDEGPVPDTHWARLAEIVAAVRR